MCVNVARVLTSVDTKVYTINGNAGKPDGEGIILLWVSGPCGGCKRSAPRTSGGHLGIGFSERPNVQTVRTHCHIFERRLNLPRRAVRQSVTLCRPAALPSCGSGCPSVELHMPSAHDRPVAWIMLIDDDNPLSLLKLRSLPTPTLQSRSLMTRSTIVLTVPTCKSPFPPYLLWHASICSLITLISPAAHSTSPCQQDAAAFSFSLAYVYSLQPCRHCPSPPTYKRGPMPLALVYFSIGPLSRSLAHSVCMFNVCTFPLCLQVRAHTFLRSRLLNMLYSLVTHACYLTALITTQSSMPFIPPPYALS